MKKFGIRYIKPLGLQGWYMTKPTRSLKIMGGYMFTLGYLSNLHFAFGLGWRLKGLDTYQVFYSTKKP